MFPCVIGAAVAASPTKSAHIDAGPPKRSQPSPPPPGNPPSLHDLDELRPGWIVRVVRLRHDRSVRGQAPLYSQARHAQSELDGAGAGSRSTLVALRVLTARAALRLDANVLSEPVAETALDRVVVHVPGAYAAHHRRRPRRAPRRRSATTRERLVSSASVRSSFPALDCPPDSRVVSALRTTQPGASRNNPRLHGQPFTTPQTLQTPDLTRERSRMSVSQISSSRIVSGRSRNIGRPLPKRHGMDTRRLCATFTSKAIAPASPADERRIPSAVPSATAWC